MKENRRFDFFIEAEQERFKNDIINFISMNEDLVKSPTDKRDMIFLNDLGVVQSSMDALLSVFYRNKHIDPGYALEKLMVTRSVINTCIKYFEGRIKEEKNA